MKREIGSEFWDIPVIDLTNTLFPEDTQWFLSGRSALQSIIKDLGEARSVALPSWCCDSVIKPFVDANYTINFYPVVFRNGLVQEIKADSDVLFIMDYFGYKSQQIDLSGYKGVVIRDVTHSIFSNTYFDGDYYFGSFRKWCGVWTGGYAWTKDGHRLLMEYSDNSEYVELRRRAMAEKAEYVDYKRNDKGFLRLFDEAERFLEGVGAAPANDRDIHLLQHMDVEFIKNRRRENAKVLRTLLPDWQVFPKPNPTDTPMFVPILVPDGKRDALRNYLIQNDIFCPVHWPVSKHHKLDERTKKIYESELSLVCDQRYAEGDMKKIVDAIMRFMEE